MNGKFKAQCLVAGASVFFNIAAFDSSAADLPEPGPESGGMRLRFMVVPEPKGTNETYQVRVDLFNVTDKPIKLLGDWPSDHYKGDYKEYLRADVSFQTEPPIMRWPAQVGVSVRESPQPEYTIGPNETLTVQWTSSNRRLRDKIPEIHYFENCNPAFLTDGLYSVHASVLLRLASDERPNGTKTITAPESARQPATNTAQIIQAASRSHFKKASEDNVPHGTIRLRSNEQFVPVGGSYSSPQHSFGRLLSVNTNAQTATIDLGLMHKTVAGNQFLIPVGMNDFWVLKISKVEGNFSEGRLAPVKWIWQHATKSNPRLPATGTAGELMAQNDPRTMTVKTDD